MTNFSSNSCQLLLIESDLGGAVVGASAGPARIRQWLPAEIPTWQRLKPLPLRHDDNWPNARRLAQIQPLLTEIQRSVADFYLHQPQQKLLVLSGDHSSACAVLSGLKTAYPDCRLGLIWIDAHADIHTPSSTPSGNLHGMPLGAVLVPTAIPSLPLWQQTQAMCSGVIGSDDLVYIGIRDLEMAEWQLLEAQQICAWTAAQVAMDGALAVAHKALSYLSAVDLLYVSFDIDALDASVAAATGTPVVGGLNELQVHQLLQVFLADPRVKLFEVTEYAPALDQQGQTGDLLQRLLSAAMPALFTRSARLQV